MINGYTLPYKVMYPKEYDESKQYPLVVFLHGAGERGDDNQKQLTHGETFFVESFHAKYPAIVIAPQCPANTYWCNVKRHAIENKAIFNFDNNQKSTQPMEVLVELVKDYLSSGKVATNQVYVGGLSMGGMGTYELLWRLPNVFAAAFPICGGGDTQKVVRNTKNTALWIFHGAEDSVVPVSFSQAMYTALLRAQREVKYSEYPGVNHNSWINAFAEKDLASWLYSHKKK
jgi:predicted peptidase